MIVATKSPVSNPRFVRKAFIPLPPPKEPPTPAVEGCKRMTATSKIEIVICAIGKSFGSSVWNIAREVCHIEAKNANNSGIILKNKGFFLCAQKLTFQIKMVMFWSNKH